MLLTGHHHLLHFVLQPDFLLLQEIHQSLHFLALPFDVRQLVSKPVFFKLAFRLLLNTVTTATTTR